MGIPLRIKAYMQKNGIKQTFLAQRLNIRDSRLSVLLSSDDMKVSDYLAICSALGVDFDFFLGSDSEKFGMEVNSNAE